MRLKFYLRKILDIFKTERLLQGCNTHGMRNELSHAFGMVLQAHLTLVPVSSEEPVTLLPHESGSTVNDVFKLLDGWVTARCASRG